MQTKKKDGIINSPTSPVIGSSPITSILENITKQNCSYVAAKKNFSILFKLNFEQFYLRGKKISTASKPNKSKNTKIIKKRC